MLFGGPKLFNRPLGAKSVMLILRIIFVYTHGVLDRRFERLANTFDSRRKLHEPGERLLIYIQMRHFLVENFMLRKADEISVFYFD